MSVPDRVHETGREQPGRGVEPRAVLADVVVVLVLFLAVGVLAGLVWPQLVDPVLVTSTEAGISTGEVALANHFDSDGWYSVLAAGCGVALGAGLMAWRRSHEVVTLLAVVGGAFLAAWSSARVGTLTGPDDPRRALAEAGPGSTAEAMVTVTAEAAYLVWPTAAVFGALLVLWGPVGEQLFGRPPQQR